MANPKPRHKAIPFKAGTSVRVKKSATYSLYCGLEGTVKEVLFKDAGIIQFSASELKKSKRADMVLRARPTVYFYFRELEKA